MEGDDCPPGRTSPSKAVVRLDVVDHSYLSPYPRPGIDTDRRISFVLQAD